MKKYEFTKDRGLKCLSARFVIDIRVFTGRNGETFTVVVSNAFRLDS